MYVAVTRAEKMLWLCESEGYMNENGALKFPSRFLSEVPEGMLRVEGKLDPMLLEGTKGLVKMLNEELGVGVEAPMTNGTRVRHRVFGEGVIEGYDPMAKSYKVRFGEVTRNLMPHVLTRE